MPPSVQMKYPQNPLLYVCVHVKLFFLSGGGGVHGHTDHKDANLHLGPLMIFFLSPTGNSVQASILLTSSSKLSQRLATCQKKSIDNWFAEKTSIFFHRTTSTIIAESSSIYVQNWISWSCDRIITFFISPNYMLANVLRCLTFLKGGNRRI